MFKLIILQFLLFTYKNYAKQLFAAGSVNIGEYFKDFVSVNITTPLFTSYLASTCWIETDLEAIVKKLTI